MNQVHIGKIGQECAEKFLKEKGYNPLGRNWQTKLGEIDLIFQDGNTLVFVEVKTIVKRTPYFQPEDHLTYSKERKLKQLALAYLNYKNLQGVPYRIDLIAVDLDENLQVLDIRHYESIVEE